MGSKIRIRVFGTELSEHEIAWCTAAAVDKAAGVKFNYAEVTVKATDEGKLAVDVTVFPPKFERIRRITGYLSGSIDTWNDSKRAEVRDRVVHGIKELPL